MNWKAFLKSNLIFFIPALIFITVGIIFLALFPKGVIHITQNGWYNSFFDTFFTYFTYLGDGYIIPIGLLILVFVKWRYAIGLGISAILTGALVGFLKEVVFNHTPRPVSFFKDFPDFQLRLIEGVNMNEWNSFPSGHTLTAFAFWGFLAFIVVKPSIKFLFVSIAMGVGYSRIYLSQHFLEDVIAGASIGIVVAIIAYFASLSLKPQWADKRLQKK